MLGNYWFQQKEMRTMSKVIDIESVRDTRLYKELEKASDDKAKAMIASLPDICEEASDRIKILPKYFQEYHLWFKSSG